jgi:hypothetical protein
MDVWSASRLGRFSPGEGTPVTIQYDARWTPKVVWTFRGREKSLVAAGIRTLDRPARSPVTVLTELPRLLLIT